MLIFFIEKTFLNAILEYNLTTREKELGYLKVNGFSNKRIEERYGIYNIND